MFVNSNVCFNDVRINAFIRVIQTFEIFEKVFIYWSEKSIKNDMLKRILHEFGIPHLCLESIGCPSHKILEQSFNQKLECDWHKNKNLNGCKQYI
jgi:hypothetical protein